ncbi:TPA: hypothetical protein ACH3X2_010569 [Trebouxia sp. C0005]
MEFLLHGSVPKSGMHAEAASPSDPICRLLIAGKNLFLASTYDIKTTHGAQKLQQSNAITGQDDYRRNLCPRILALKPIRQAKHTSWASGDGCTISVSWYCIRLMHVVLEAY